MGQKCKATVSHTAFAIEVADVASQAAGIGAQTVGNATQNPDEVVTDVVNSPEFQAAVKKIVAKRAKQVYLDSEAQAKRDGADLNILGKAALKSAKNATQSSLKSNPEYLKLKKDVTRLRSSMMCTPTGVWVTENKRKPGFLVVAVVGFAAAAGGVVYWMHNDKSADEKIGGFIEGMKKAGQAPIIGSYDIKVRRFSPYEGKAAIDFSSEQKFKSLTVGFTLHQTVDYTKGKGLKGNIGLKSLGMKFEISPDTTVTGSYGRDRGGSQRIKVGAEHKMNENTTVNIQGTTDGDKNHSVSGNIRIDF